jgi:hypothetical protein
MLGAGGAVVMPEHPEAVYTRPEVPDEDELIEGAARAVETAIANLHARGIATTHLIDGRLVRVHPDGRREDLGLPSRS